VGVLIFWLREKKANVFPFSALPVSKSVLCSISLPTPISIQFHCAPTEANSRQTQRRASAAELKKGNAKVFSALTDRAYGKPRQQIEFAGEDGGPIQSSIVVRFVRAGEGEEV
jgi:hypothetical protein